jgi:hypothetical protein
VLLGSGAVVGLALTGGAQASTGSDSAATAAKAATASAATAKAGTARHGCAKLAVALKDSDHADAARRVSALCKRPLLRLAAVGGTHGEVTFDGKNGQKTLAFERGTVASVSGSLLTVTAKDGTSWTWDLTSGTVIRSAGQKVTTSSLSSGEKVFVGGLVSGGSKDATLVRIAKDAS